jgi:hypothetical protein
MGTGRAAQTKISFGETPKRTRGTRVLPRKAAARASIRPFEALEVPACARKSVREIEIRTLTDDKV